MQPAPVEEAPTTTPPPAPPVEDGPLVKVFINGRYQVLPASQFTASGTTAQVPPKAPTPQ